MMSISTVRGVLLALVAASVIPTVTAAVVFMAYIYNEERAGLRQGLRETTRALSLVVDREIGRREAIARTLSESPTLTTGDLAGFYDYAKAIAPSWDSVVILHAMDGRQLLNTRMPLNATLPASELSNERRAAGARATVVSDLYFAPVGKEYSFAVQVPVVRGGEVVYFLSFAGFASSLQTIMVDQGLPPSWIGSVFDAKGIIVARNERPAEFVGKPMGPRLAAQLKVRAAGVFESVAIDGRPILSGFSRSPAYGWTAAIGVPLSELTLPNDAALRFGLLSLILLATSLLAAVLLGRRLARPVALLLEASRDVGSAAPLELTATGLVETDRVLAALAAADLRIRSANELMEARVAEALGEAERAQLSVQQSQRLEALVQLTGGVAHDFNNLLMVVKTNVHLLRISVPELADSAPLDRIQRATDTGAQLTRQLLAFARRQPLRPEYIDLRARVSDVMSLVRPAMGSAIEVSCEVQPDVGTIFADVAEFELALINLAVNARDAMPDGGKLTVAARPVQSQDGEGMAVSLEVSDTGQGIPAEAMARIFEPFFTTKPVGKGTGLGLSQVHGFVTEIGGTVKVLSSSSAGTRIQLLLPVVTAPVQNPEEPQAPHPQFDGRGRKLLLVEDNNEVAVSTQELLRNSNLVVTRAVSGDEARGLLEGGTTYDCVLSDIRMPGSMDGIALATWMRDARVQVPIVLMTGYSAELRQAFGLGLQVVPKPCAPATLLEALDTVMGKGLEV